MDPMTASAAVVLLASFFAKTGEKLVENIGENLAGKTSQIYQSLKEKFTNDEYAGLTLLRLQEAPENEGRKSALENVIKEKMEEDKVFAEHLTQLIKEAKGIDTKNIIASGERSVAIGGDVTSSNINTGEINQNKN